MHIKDISVPDVYTDSQDFRFFLNWIATCLEKIHYDTENGMDLYDPLRCPEDLLWMLADTMGYKYDDRLPTSFNRFVLVYFMSMIRNRGSKDGVTLAAETNLKQFDIDLVAGTGYVNKDGEIVEPNEILYNRLEDTSIPVNTVAVTPHTAEGYIDVVYFSDRLPIDACIEYVRPLGMYCFQNAGVRMDARTKLSIDARLTNIEDNKMSIGSTHVGHYSRTDYARMQRLEPSDLVDGHEKTMVDNPTFPAELSDTRRNVWYRNADYEGGLHDDPVQAKVRNINPGYRALYSLQLCNNEHIVKSLLPMKDHIFGLGWNPQDVSMTYPDDYSLPDIEMNDLPGGKNKPWNLRYDKTAEESLGDEVYTLDEDRSTDILNPRPAVNPIMKVIGDAISLEPDNRRFGVAYNHDGTYPISDENISKDGEIAPHIQNGEIAVGDLHMDDAIPSIHEPEDAILDRQDNVMLDHDDSYIRATNDDRNGE